jgi:hypothetical protein
MADAPSEKEIEMRTSLRKIVLIGCALALSALPAAAQMGIGAPPPDFRGVFSPVVGSGATYEVDSKGVKRNIEITVVGKEDVEGKPGYWMEIGLNDPRAGGQMYIKNLMVIDGKSGNLSRTIIQAPGRPPMEISGMAAMMNRGQAQKPTSTDFRDQAELVGTEDVTTPAGTFSCQHYRAKDGSGDVWVSTKVTPWGLVKATGKDGGMTLASVVTDAKDHITGTPQKFDPAEMMRQSMGQQPKQ